MSEILVLVDGSGVNEIDGLAGGLGGLGGEPEGFDDVVDVDQGEFAGAVAGDDPAAGEFDDAVGSDGFSAGAEDLAGAENDSGEAGIADEMLSFELGLGVGAALLGEGFDG